MPSRKPSSSGRASPGRYPCSHPKCEAKMPEGETMPEGWMVARIEKYSKTEVSYYYLYLCPKHKIITTERQTELFR